MDIHRPAAVLRFFVGGVGIDATESQVQSAFSEIGVTLTNVELVVNRATGCKRGFAFVSVNAPAKGSAITPRDVLDRMQAATVNGRAPLVSEIEETGANALWVASRAIQDPGAAADR
jgi:hypothetical protein